MTSPMPQRKATCASTISSYPNPPMEKILKFPRTPKEHPYASHISRFAMFPAFRSSGSGKPFPFISPIVPPPPTNVILRSKTKGGPYRHEVLEMPSSEDAAISTEDYGFVDLPKPAKGIKHAMYPAPVKAVLPTPKVEGDLTASERSHNMAKSFEKMHWMTSYQMHYKGHTDDAAATLDYEGWQPDRQLFNLKMNDITENAPNTTGRPSQSAPLRTERDRSLYVSLPSKARQGIKKRQEKNTRNAYADVYSNASPAPKQRSARSQQSSRKIASDPKEATTPQIAPQVPSGPERAESSGTNRVAGNICGDYESKKATKVRFNETQTRERETEPPQIPPRPPVLPEITPVRRAVGSSEGAAGDLLGLQGSYTKTKAHQDFNSSINYDSVNLRDNVVSGKKHNFYGINCNYIHG
uniref:uncharacterized protein LOC131136553 isoform X2 n=1 Tax=Doryrhamphus excisus TaxID=161450 RepID=UPI0025AE5BE2|nr:uncharacterized protein LOC131136553 isoform X2 [Doryrhamphus excisus]XP_057939513.1 uncharacterized protein LOC131136553 isoform X2 [Doryrhamphus excisus]